ncbi:MAG: cache domain-containing protein, partial [Methanogenium sp.]
EWRIAVIRDMQDSSSPTMVFTPRSDEELNRDISGMTSFLEEAVIFAQMNGRDVACESFNDPEGAFIDGGLYIFAYDMNATTLAHPYQPGIIGENRMAIADENGLEM